MVLDLKVTSPCHVSREQKADHDLAVNPIRLKGRNAVGFPDSLLSPVVDQRHGALINHGADLGRIEILFHDVPSG